MGMPMRYQPQGRAQLDRSNPLAAGAQAIISAAQSANLVSQKTLASSGTINRAFSPAGKAIQFRKNGYLETEALPALGTASFVEFWYGYPSADLYASGSSSQDPGFLTGSSANMVGICGSIGSRTGGGANWGAVYNWNSSQINNAGEVLTPGQLTLLVVVRRQSGMELWRNGRLIKSFAQTPVSYPAETLICGSFVEDVSYWSSSSDTVLAGRILGEWSADQVRGFSANPWQIFTEGSRSSSYQAAIASTSASATPVSAAMAWTEDSDTTSIATLFTNRSAVAWVESGDLAALTGVITDRGALAWIEQGDTYILSVAAASPPMAVAAMLSWVDEGDSASFFARLTNRVDLAIIDQGDSWAILAEFELPPATPLPRVYVATIMRATITNRTADLGPSAINLNTGFP